MVAVRGGPPGTRPRRYYEGRLDDGETVVVEGKARSDHDHRPVAPRVGASIGGGRMVVADGTQDGAARRSLRSAAISLLARLAVAAVLAFLWP